MSDRPNPARLVADADVLAADVFVDGDARRALDHVREHSWVELVATEELLDDAAYVVATLGDDELANAWRERIEELVELVDQQSGDHPGLAAAHHGNAAHLLSFDDGLRTADVGMKVKARTDVSIKHPAGFATLFSPESLYDAVVGGEYPGPDCDPRADSSN